LRDASNNRLATPMAEDLPFRVIRVNSEDEILARATNLIHRHGLHMRPP
jgi:hypothetical protein